MRAMLIEQGQQDVAAGYWMARHHSLSRFFIDRGKHVFDRIHILDGPLVVPGQIGIVIAKMVFESQPEIGNIHATAIQGF